jgi:hypothetical protein
MNRLCLLLIVISFLTVPAAPEDACKTSGAKTAAKKGESAFVCDRLAFSPEVRKRHFEVLGPALGNLRTNVRELPNGYEFQFPSDPKTIAMIDEWAEQERLCCPFFDIDVRFEHEGGPTWLRLTGRPGTKEFMRVEGAEWIRK